MDHNYTLCYAITGQFLSCTVRKDEVFVYEPDTRMGEVIPREEFALMLRMVRKDIRSTIVRWS